MKNSNNKDQNELLNVVTGDILPVDLNSFLCRFRMKCSTLAHNSIKHFLEMQIFCLSYLEN